MIIRFYSLLSKVPFVGLLSLLFIFPYSSYSQVEKSIISSFETYSKLPREVAYLHLNKSIYIKGESIAFSGYVIDKNTKKPSELTTNLYCVVTDQNGKTIKSQLIRVSNGFSSGSFDIDNDFKSGEYTIKAYTNWMRNFDEQNLFVENIKIIDPETDEFVKPETLKNTIDAQFLPEGGHMVTNVQITVGVVLKDANGFGISSVEAEILDSKNSTITTFKTNQFGISRFLLTPKANETYTAEFEYLGETFNFKINTIDLKGFSLSLTDLGKNVALKFNTNSETLPSIKNETYKLAIHNGKSIKVTDFNFEGLEVVKLLSKNDLSPGINIFTVFDKDNNPLLERLYFKHDGIENLKTETPTVHKATYDSLTVMLPIKAITSEINHNISVSVLPDETKSYQSHHNIISYMFLQPYVKGYIENAAYYFENTDRRKIYELDNLLITQGWSSYNWNNIFNTPPKNTYVFETGIGFKANINTKKSNQFLMFALRESKGDVFVTGANEKNFIKTGLYPYNDEKVKIGEIDKKGKMSTPNMYLQFSPSEISLYSNAFSVLKAKSKSLTSTTQIQPFTQSILEGTQTLDEILIETNKKETKTEGLEKRSFGNVEVFDDRTRLANRTLAQYLSKKGFVTSDYGGVLSITVRNPLTPNNTTPVVYLNDVLLSDFSFLATFDMNSVDYIEINKTGLGSGMRGGAGIIKIYSDPNVEIKRKYGDNYKTYDIPLTFTKSKQFYTPKYSYYKTRFFKEYGVIDWIPNVQTDANGNLVFSVFDTGIETVKLFIEGITDDGRFIVEEKTINLN
ncbi:hypothetical protein [Psychroserpens sp.]|uniref:hypothetical protein n=1 Tax=Psychroserpens sp. TaxID=2020870 RepID=UPI002B270276|nr:hypothetical protein [Psychroserpens sp.]